MKLLQKTKSKPIQLIFAALLLSAILAPRHSSAQTLRLANVMELSEQVTVSGKELQISYLLQCGESYSGTVFARGEKAQHWFVGVLINSDNFRCTSAAKLAFIKHPIIISKDTLKKESNSQKMLFSPIQETSNSQSLTWTKAKHVKVNSETNNATPRFISYDSGCGEFVGVLINHQRKDRRFYGVLEGFKKKNSSQSSCVKKRAKTYLPREFVSHDFWQGAKLRAPVNDDGQNELSYKLVPISLKKIRYKNASSTNKQSTIQVPYFRTCRQAPLGLIVQDKGNNNFAIGVVIAEKSGQKCRQGRKFEWQTIISSMQLPQKAKLTSIRNLHKNSSLNIHAPNIGPLGKAEDLRLKVVTDSCQKLLGTLYSEQSKFTSIGIITETDTQCQISSTHNNIKLIAEQRLSYHPPFIKDFIQKDIYPFQM
ncbi:MAG: hypothetical protein KBD78_02245 [Oligoflexales bacterium]|nr:hypothetical protein [Oligoflexales bacterium]